MTADELRAKSHDYIEGKQRAKEEDEWTPEQLAELKFGTRKLFIALTAIVAAALVAVLLPLLL